MKALIIIDMQYDFLPGGSLAIPKGDEIIDTINDVQKYFNLVVATQDWHPKNHGSFASNHNKKTFTELKLPTGINQTLWPDHCVQNTVGAELHKNLNLNKVNAIFRKGTNPSIDSYSCFFDNVREKDTGLNGYLKSLYVTDLYFTGVATDYCVYYSIIDALELNYACTLIEDATKPIDDYIYQNDIKPKLLAKGCKFISSNNF